ncbi:MAG: hypothetical protein IJ343_03400 [Clostridia bacterium]|nr:hypothetical protein [Clostridia bacterium]
MSGYTPSARGRIGRYLTVTVSITLVAYIIRTLVSAVLARESAEAIAQWSTCVSLTVNVLAAIVVSAMNRSYTFRSNASWALTIPVMVVLELLFDMLTGMLWSPVMRELMQMPLGLEGGYYLMLISYGFNIVQFAVWAVLAYLFQRYVLYRNTLDALLLEKIEE